MTACHVGLQPDPTRCCHSMFEQFDGRFMSGAVVQRLRFRRSDAGDAGLAQLVIAIGQSGAETTSRSSCRAKQVAMYACNWIDASVLAVRTNIVIQLRAVVEPSPSCYFPRSIRLRSAALGKSGGVGLNSFASFCRPYPFR